MSSTVGSMPILAAIYVFTKYCFTAFICLLCSNFLHAQKPKGHPIGYEIVNGDTLYVDKISPAYVFNRPERLKKTKEWRKFYKTVYNFAKVYPYALKAKEIMQDADSTIANSNFTAREREKYIKEYERKLFREFDPCALHLHWTPFILHSGRDPLGYHLRHKAHICHLFDSVY